MRELRAADGQPGWYRNSARAWSALTPVIGFCVLLPVSFRVDGAPGAAELAVTALCVLVAAVAITIVPRAGIKVDVDGVTVRNSAGVSQQVPWSQVIRFEAIPQSSAQGRHGSLPSRVKVICRGRKPIDSFGCSARVHAGDISPKVWHLVTCLEAVRLRQPGQRTGGDAAAR